MPHFFLLLLLFHPLLSSSSANPLFDEEVAWDEGDLDHAGSLFSSVFADSKEQLILDIDMFRSIVNAHLEYGRAIQEGNMELVRYGIILVERMKQFDISAGCLADLFHLTWSAVEYATFVEETKNCTSCQCTPYIHQKKNERQWIFNVLDAFGKMPSGLTGGNNLWVGSWTTCRKISVAKNNQGQRWKGQYCLAHLNPYNRDNPLKSIGPSGPPDARCYRNPNATETPAQEDPNDSKCFDLIPLLNFGLCMPDTCTAYDVRKMVKMLARGVETFAGRDLVCNVSVECRNEREEAEISQSPLSMVSLLLLSFLIIMFLFGSIYDYVVVSEQRKTGAFVYNQQPLFIKSLLAFSALVNLKKVMETEEKGDQISCLFGMRFLSMAWIILGHLYYYIARSFTTDNLIPTLVNFPKMFYTQIIVQAPLAVDSFFFLSGLLATYITFKKLVKDKTIKRNQILSVSGWLVIYLRRYLRLTPMYAFVMLMNVTLFTFVSNGPFWRPIEPEGCRHTWWVNLLYLNNFVMQDVECCMGWTWYMANDFQFHVVLFPILVISLYLNKKIGLSISALFILASTVIKAIIMEIKEYPPAPLLTAKLTIVDKLDSYWNDVYVMPYIRCGPFICGCVVGFLMIDLTTNQKNSIDYKISTKVSIIGWTLSTILGLYSVFGLYEYARTGDISDWWRILYVLMGRNGFSFAISWVTFACSTGNGGIVTKILSFKTFIPLGKITFGAYLIHPILLQIYNLSRPQPFHFTTFFQMFMHFIEAVFVSYFAALVVHLLVEAPNQTFEGMLFGGLTAKKRETPALNNRVDRDGEDAPMISEKNGIN